MGSDRNRHVLRQLADLSRTYPDSRKNLKYGRLTWTGDIQPGPACDTYRVRITWDGRSSRPAVHVLSPNLTALLDEDIPHRFEGGNLCLHYNGEWDPTMLISETIIPWTSEWLLHYELWLATGEWLGGGHDPGGKQEHRAEPEPDGVPLGPPPRKSSLQS